MAIYGDIWGCNQQNFNLKKQIAQNFIFKRAKNYEELKDSKHIKKRRIQSDFKLLTPFWIDFEFRMFEFIIYLFFWNKID